MPVVQAQCHEGHRSGGLWQRSLVPLVVLFLVAGCGTRTPSQQPATGGSAPQAGSAPAASAQNQPARPAQPQQGPPEAKVNIGYSGPLSGGAAIYGQNTLNGLQMAADEINKSGGINVGGKRYAIHLVPLDDKYLPNETATNARRLLEQYETPIIFTPHSGGVFAMQEFNEQDGFIIAAYTSEPRVTQRGNKLTLRIPAPYDAYAVPYSKAVMEAFGKKVALVPGTHQYAKDWTAVFTKAWESLGGTVTGNFAANYNTETDFTPFVTKALATNPDVLFVGGPSQPTALVIKTAREQGFKGGFVVMDQAKFEEMEEIVPIEMLNGAVGLMPLYRYPGPATQQFVEQYKARFGKRPTYEQAQHYQAMYLVAKALERAGTVTDVEKIMASFSDAIQQLPRDKVPIIWRKLNDKGGIVGEVIGVMVKDGKYDQQIPIPVQESY